ncbi:MAG TPA: DNA recombination protein RmuC [Candidatus Limnocylindrales bacterium]|nr:DNA recombination protein RmuC [Candidatus Limnocylindrales bacterium]
MNVPAPILVLLFLAAAALVAIALGRRPAPSTPSDAVLRSLADLGALRGQVEAVTAQQASITQALTSLHGAVQGVESRVLESSAGVREVLTREVQEARVVVERLKADGEARRRMEEEVQASARRIENVLLGSRTRGAAGENILQDAFRQFPPEMIETNFRVNGKVVEYALVLANARRLPIDSKWPSPELLDRLGQDSQDPIQGAALTAEVERVLKAKVRDVHQYIDPSCTLAFAVAAVPDPVFNACRRGHLEAYREGVILMPYSMTVPYVLALFRLHLQYARSIDLENLEGYLQQVDDNLAAIDRSLENSISRGSIMIQNAFADCKRNVGQIRGALAALRALPSASTAELPQPPSTLIGEGAAEPALPSLFASVGGYRDQA